MFDAENCRSLVRFPVRPIFFPMIDDSHCDRIHSSLTAVCCFNNGYVRKHPVAWKEYCAEYWLNELKESMDKCHDGPGVAHLSFPDCVV